MIEDRPVFDSFRDYCDFASFRLSCRFYDISSRDNDRHGYELVEQIYAMWRGWA